MGKAWTYPKDTCAWFVARACQQLFATSDKAVGVAAAAAFVLVGVEIFDLCKGQKQVLDAPVDCCKESGPRLIAVNLKANQRLMEGHELAGAGLNHTATRACDIWQSIQTLSSSN